MSFGTISIGISARDALALPSRCGCSSSASVDMETVSTVYLPGSISCGRVVALTQGAHGSVGRSLELGVRFGPPRAVGLGREEPFAESAGREQGGGDDWESEIFEDFKSSGGQDWNPRSQDEEPVSRGRSTQADWSTKARERAVEAIRDRGLPVGSVLGEATKKKKKRKKAKKKPVLDFRITKAQLERLENRISNVGDEPARPLNPERMQPLTDSPWMKDLGSGNGFNGLLGGHWNGMGNPAVVDTDAMDCRDSPISYVSPSVKTASVSGAQRRSVTSRQKRQEDFELNRKLVGAANADDVLSIVGEVMGNDVWGPGEFPLSSFNISTSLHRIAKHMEATSMPKSDRLVFARKKMMARLVSAAMESLRECSSQSISNISWALSKVGGASLYWTEMDALAEVAILNITDLKPQHMANIAGAFACMQHSVPRLFDALDYRASIVHRDFRPQELAQLLWAFAAMNQSSTLLMNSLDSECQDEGVMRTADAAEGDDTYDNQGVDISEDDKQTSEHKLELDRSTELEGGQSIGWVSIQDYFANSSLSQLASFSWSYTVLNQLRRPSFGLIWRAISGHGLGTTSRVEDLPCPRLQLSQLHQTKIGLQLEASDLELTLGEPLERLAREQWENIKSGRKNTSVAQLDVERLLTGMGQCWVTEYTALDYSVDAAFVERKIGLEIDGPTHFARNTGVPLGHTVLKRRHLGAVGWTMLSIPYQEWDDQIGEQEQLQYLCNLLRNYL